MIWDYPVTLGTVNLDGEDIQLRLLPDGSYAADGTQNVSAGQLLRAHRLSVGYRTIVSLAQDIGVSIPTVQSWELDRNPIPAWVGRYVFLLSLYRTVRGDAFSDDADAPEEVGEPGKMTYTRSDPRIPVAVLRMELLTQAGVHMRAGHLSYEATVQILARGSDGERRETLRGYAEVIDAMDRAIHGEK